jgi:signal transduction histidine kinase/CheY-like chemotaxis protein
MQPWFRPSEYASTPPADLAFEVDDLRAQLRYERSLRHFDSQLNEYILAFLSETNSLGGNATNTDSMAAVQEVMLQAVAQTLHDGLGGVPVAIAVPRLSTHSVHPIYDLQLYDLPSPSPSDGIPAKSSKSGSRRRSKNRSLLVWPLPQGNIPLQNGQTLTQADIHGLQTAFPQDIWQLLPTPNDPLWLLLYRTRWRWQPPDLAQTNAWIAAIITRLHTAAAQLERVHDQHQQRHRLLQQNAELTQANQLKSEFLANTSHEIRTPLSSILGFTHLLQQQGYNPASSRHQDYLKIILSSGQHLLALINDILDLSKIEANQLSLQWDAVDVAKVCDVALMLVREKASDRGLTLHLDIDPAICTARLDSLRLKQMLFNLLSNAVKFTVNGAIGLQVRPLGSYLEFTVWDTGTGISPEQQALLFKPYSQIANAAVNRGEGTGLGLVLTQKLAELHGGRVEVVSELGQGSRFTIVLPTLVTVEPACERSPEPPSTIPSATGSRLTASPATVSPTATSDKAGSDGRPAAKTSPAPSIPTASHNSDVLLVEDNLHNAKLILTYLTRLGYAVHWAKDGRELWQHLANFAQQQPAIAPALILMDINLPDADGLDLIRQLKADSRYAHLPIVAQTAMAMKGDRTLCLEAGADDYLSKPIDLNKLATLVCHFAPTHTHPLFS